MEYPVRQFNNQLKTRTLLKRTLKKHLGNMAVEGIIRSGFNHTSTGIIVFYKGVTQTVKIHYIDLYLSYDYII